MKTGLSNTENVDTPNKENDLGALYDAIQSGNNTELSRLMSADVEKDPDKKDAESAEDSTTEADDPSKTDADDKSAAEEVKTKDTKDQESDQGEKETDSGTTKEAAPAASTRDAADDVAALKAEIEELRAQAHRYQSDAGRVPYLQRRLAELERQARAPQEARQSPAAKDGTASVSDDDLKNIVLDPVTQKEIDDLKEVDPVVARAMERSVKAAAFIAQQRFEAAFNERENRTREVEDRQFYEEQMSELTAQIPQAPQIFQTPEWAEWKAGLTHGQRAMAESPYAADVVRAIHAFAADMQARMGGRKEEAASGKDKPNPPEARSEVAEARARKAEGSPEVRNPSAKNTSELDRDKLFSQIYNEEGKKSHILT